MTPDELTGETTKPGTQPTPGADPGAKNERAEPDVLVPAELAANVLGAAGSTSEFAARGTRDGTGRHEADVGD